MKNISFVLALVGIFSVFLFAQEPESFFPHNVGDKWNYIFSTGYDDFLQQKILFRDSLGEDESHNLFYNQSSLCEYRIDTALNVYEYPTIVTLLLYKLDADTGEYWETGYSGTWGWLASVETMYVFSELTVVKKFRYGSAPPDSANSSGSSQSWLASDFGIIYGDGETEYMYLEGCVIGGDTFGIFTSVEDIDEEIPSNFELKQNYPNPFNPVTTIEFNLPHEAEVKMSICDILGREMEVIYNGWAPAGIQKIKWNAAGFASGIYFCRILTGGKFKTIKMAFTK